MKWFFDLDDKGVVQLTARLEGGGMIGDVHEELEPDQEFYGISYDTLAKIKSGVMDVDEDGKATLAK